MAELGQGPAPKDNNKDNKENKDEDTIGEELLLDENGDPIVDVKMSISTLLRESSEHIKCYPGDDKKK